MAGASRWLVAAPGTTSTPGWRVSAWVTQSAAMWSSGARAESPERSSNPVTTTRLGSSGGARFPRSSTAGVLLLGNRAPPLDPRRAVGTGVEDLSGDAALAPLGHIAADVVTPATTRQPGVAV